MNASTELPQYFSTDAVAELFGVSTRHVRRMIASGELRAIQLGRVYRIAPAAIDEYAAAHTVRQPGGE